MSAKNDMPAVKFGKKKRDEKGKISSLNFLFHLGTWRYF